MDNNDISIPIQVTTVGTEMRSSKLLSYTSYVVNVTIDQVSRKLFLRYSEIRQLRKIIIKDFPSLSTLPKLSKKIQQTKTKVVEKRKVILEDFLQQILTSKLV